MVRTTDDDKMTEIYVCRAKEECPIHCKVEMPMYRIDKPACASRENCPFQIMKILRIGHLPK